jgi:hypothetical protein
MSVWLVKGAPSVAGTVLYDQEAGTLLERLSTWVGGLCYVVSPQLTSQGMAGCLALTNEYSGCVDCLGPVGRM